LSIKQECKNDNESEEADNDLLGNCRLWSSPGHSLYLFWAKVIYNFIASERSPKKDAAPVLVAGFFYYWRNVMK
jgi:hypothetical protein